MHPIGYRPPNPPVDDGLPLKLRLALVGVPALLLLVGAVVQTVNPPPPARSAAVERWCQISISDYPSVSLTVDGPAAPEICAMLRRESKAVHSPALDRYWQCGTSVNGTQISAASNESSSPLVNEYVCGPLQTRMRY